MNSSGYQSKLKNLENLIGNTPLLEINLEFNGKPRTIYAKAENFNLTGSIKDRMAFYIIKNAYERNELNNESTIIEATSGNTGIAFSAIGKILGHDVVIFMPNWLSQERINLIKSYGAQIILVSIEEGGFLGSIKKSESYAAELEKSFLPKQFSNNDNCYAHYNTTGPEIYWQLYNNGIKPNAFVAGVGTGGTIMGTGSFLKEKFSEIKLFPLEPSNSPTLSTGFKVGSHRIQGISDEFIPSILDLSKLDRVIEVDDGDAIIMSQKLAKELGLGVGISSGANLLGALIVQNELGNDSIIVTVFPDDNKKYLSTDLFKTEPIKDNFLSPKIKLLSFRAFNRDCKTCNSTGK